MTIRPVVGFELDTERFVRREGSGYRKSETLRKDLLDSTDVTPPGGVVQLALRRISKKILIVAALGKTVNTPRLTTTFCVGCA